jgi:chromosome segregation ATPase
LSTLVLCGLLSGCTGDPRGDAIQNVVDLMGTAAGDTGGITEEVKKAVKSHVDKKEPLDFEGAIEAAKKLRKTGEQLQAVKVSRVDQAGTATDDEKKEYAERFRARINDARARLQSAKNELNAELQKAEAIDADAKKKVEELRTKIREAEGPFETLARQQG